MSRDRRRWMIRVVTGLAAVCCGAAVSQTGPQALPDGSLVKGVEGRLSKDGDRWLLGLETQVGQGPTALKEGTAFELLPSGILEALVADAADGPQRRYRLSGQVETYRGRVYLFPTSFVPLASIVTDANGVVASRPHQDPNRPPSAAVAGSADRLAIPEQIQKRLADYQAARQRSWRGRTVPPSRLQVLLDQVGVVVQDQQRTFFVTDGLGQNAMARVFEVLPCATLESMERLQLQAPEPMRFRVGGLLTEYEGRSCVLLHRAVREYAYGNLGR